MSNRDNTAIGPVAFGDRPLRTDEQSSVGASAAVPVCVDLDGTLVRSDLLVEALFALLARNFAVAFLIPFWLLRGRARLKAEVGRRTNLDVESLPYNERLLAYLREQRAAGRRLVLATAAPERLAHQVADHLGLFDEVVATEGSVNLKGARKAEALVARFGERGFDYAGNGHSDLAVWRHARRADSGRPRSWRGAALQRAVAAIETVIENGRAKVRDYVKALRLHQWSKNASGVSFLCSRPIGRERSGSSCRRLIAFFAFGLCASSVYLLNDLLDLPADRAHPRNVAARSPRGPYPIAHGVALVPLLLLAPSALHSCPRPSLRRRLRSTT